MEKTNVAIAFAGQEGPEELLRIESFAHPTHRVDIALVISYDQRCEVDIPHRRNSPEAQCLRGETPLSRLV